MSPLDMESPPALGAEGRAIAVGASAEPAYTIRAIRAIIQATVSPLIDVLNLIDGDPDAEPSGDELDQSFPEAAGSRESLPPRFSELRAMGMVEPTGARRRNPSGKGAAVLRLTVKGRAAL